MELPKFVKDKKAVINMLNHDNQCCKWAVTRALNPVEKDQGRITKTLKQQAEERFNWTGVSFPTPIHGLLRVAGRAGVGTPSELGFWVRV